MLATFLLTSWTSGLAYCRSSLFLLAKTPALAAAAGWLMLTIIFRRRRASSLFSTFFQHNIVEGGVCLAAWCLPVSAVFGSELFGPHSQFYHLEIYCRPVFIIITVYYYSR